VPGEAGKLCPPCIRRLCRQFSRSEEACLEAFRNYLEGRISRGDLVERLRREAGVDLEELVKAV